MRARSGTRVAMLKRIESGPIAPMIQPRFSQCKYCGGLIRWLHTDEGWRPIEPTTLDRHDCPEREKALRPIIHKSPRPQ